MENPRILGVGPRVAALLREVYPHRPRAKLIARDFGVSPKTAERWLAGHAPVVADLEAMAVKWNVRFLEVLFPEALADRDERIRELQRELSQAGDETASRADSDRTRFSVREGATGSPALLPSLTSTRHALLAGLAADVDAQAIALRPRWWRRCWARANAWCD